MPKTKTKTKYLLLTLRAHLTNAFPWLFEDVETHQSIVTKVTRSARTSD